MLYHQALDSSNIHSKIETGDKNKKKELRNIANL